MRCWSNSCSPRGRPTLEISLPASRSPIPPGRSPSKTREWSFRSTAPSEHCHAQNDHQHADDLERIGGLMKCQHGRDGYPHVAQSDQWIKDGKLTVAQGINEHHRKHAVQTVSEKQLRYGKNPDQRCQQACMR